MTTTPDLQAEWWTTSDVAAYIGVRVATVVTYRKREQMPAPDMRVDAPYGVPGVDLAARARTRRAAGPRRADRPACLAGDMAMTLDRYTHAFESGANRVRKSLADFSLTTDAGGVPSSDDGSADVD